MKKSVVALALWLVLAGVAGAQDVLTGKIFGQVTDPAGGAMPNVTVTLTSPSELQPLVATTGNAGEYQFPGLPIGTYSVKFEAAGYRPLLRENIVIDSGFNAEINARLEIAGVTQTVEVSSEAPVVDTQSTAIDAHFGQDTLQDIPTSRDQSSAIRMTPNVLLGADVGGNQNMLTGTGNAHGSASSQGIYFMDGVELGTPAGAQDAWIDYDSIKEETIGLGGADVTQQTEGIQANMISKSGGDIIHGSVHFAFEDEKFESTNLSPAQRQNAALSGASAGNPLKRFSDWGAEFGGPIKKGKVWYWVDYTRQVTTLGEDKIFEPRAACSPVAASPLSYSYATIRSCTPPIPLVAQHAAYKISWSPFHNNTLNFLNRYDVKQEQLFGYSPLRPLLSTQILAGLYAPQLGYSYGPRFWDAGWPSLWKWDDQEVLSDHWVLDVSYAHFNKSNQQLLHSQSLVNVMPIFEQSTSQYNDSFLYSIADQPENNITAVTSYFVPNKLGGSHTIKAGYGYIRFENFEQEYYGGDGLLIYKSGTLAPFTTPFAVEFFQPSKINAFLYSQFAYVMDTFTRKRFTFNLGVRFDHQRDTEGPENIPASPYEGDITMTGIPFNLMPAMSYPGATSPAWNTFAPRLGVTYDLTGSGKTVLKASYDVYFDQRSAGQLSDIHNFTGVATASQGTTPNDVEYPWTGGTINGVVNMADVNISGAPLAFGGNYNPANPLQTTTPNSINPDIKDPRTDEVVAAVNRELASGWALDVSFIFRHYSNYIYKEPVGITAANYFPCVSSATATTSCSYTPPGSTTPVTTTLAPTTCPAGANCQPVTYYVPNIKVPATYEITNQPNYTTRYRGIEAVLSKRLSGRAMLNIAYTYQSNTQHFGPGSYTDPTNIALENNTIIAPIATATATSLSVPAVTEANWVIRGSGLYRFPWKIQVSAFENIHQGYPLEDTILIGTRANSAGSVAVLEGAPGSQRLPTFYQTDIRIERPVKISERFELQPSLDFYNLFNANNVIAVQTSQNSSSEGYLGAVLGPRVGRVTARLVF